MRRAGLLGGALAILGAFGLVQIHVVDITITGSAAIIVVVVLAALALLASRLVGWSPVRSLPATVHNLDRNPARRGRRSYVVTGKKLVAEILPGASKRRDAHLKWELTLRNAGKHPLARIELALLGEVPAATNDLDVTVHTEQESKHFLAAVRRDDPISPTVAIGLPAPGLRSGESVTLAFDYSWPGLAHIDEDCWIIDLARMPEGSGVAVELGFPDGDTQIGEVTVLRRRLGLRTEVELGRLDALPSAEASVAADTSLQIAYTTEPNDEMMLISTRRLRPTHAG